MANLGQSCSCPSQRTASFYGQRACLVPHPHPHETHLTLLELWYQVLPAPQKQRPSGTRHLPSGDQTYWLPTPNVPFPRNTGKYRKELISVLSRRYSDTTPGRRVCPLRAGITRPWLQGQRSGWPPHPGLPHSSRRQVPLSLRTFSGAWGLSQAPASWSTEKDRTHDGWTAMGPASF